MNNSLIAFFTWYFNDFQLFKACFKLIVSKFTQMWPRIYFINFHISQLLYFIHFIRNMCFNLKENHFHTIDKDPWQRSGTYEWANIKIFISALSKEPRNIETKNCICSSFPSWVIGAREWTSGSVKLIPWQKPR